MPPAQPEVVCPVRVAPFLPVINRIIDLGGIMLELPPISKTPFIMVTAESKTENVIAAKKAGVNNYIVKPFNAATLKSKMVAVLGDFS